MKNEAPNDETPPMRCRRCDAVLKQGSLKCDLCGYDHRASPMIAGDWLQPGDVIGDYELINVLGEGGFGVVWRALQKAPLKREVALKLLKPGMVSPEVGKRFEFERERLAMMIHPNIAAVYDAGTTPGGWPYFVMELVQGLPITAYCDQHKLSIRERLRLFVDVCHGVQHAHHKGVLHRDLKPSNILVVQVDGKQVPKIIDFGIAKALQAPAENPLLTQPEVIIGTRCYMSPEQAGKEPDVDARSDVYALGVVLYELLTGHLPLSAEQLQEAAWQEAQRIIQEVDPPKPSSRAHTSTHEQATSRQCEPKSLANILENDLDWVALMALEKDRQRRYTTPTELANDLQRYLNNQPVTAAPQTWHYQLRKFAARNRVAVALGSLAALALVFMTAAGVIWAGKQSADARAAELDKDLDQKRRETVAGLNSLHFERTRWEMDNGSPRRAVAWLTQALREQPDDQASLDVLIRMLEDREWIVPLEEVQLSKELLTPDESRGEKESISTAFGKDGSLVALKYNYGGEETREFTQTFRGQPWKMTRDFTREDGKKSVEPLRDPGVKATAWMMPPEGLPKGATSVFLDLLFSPDRRYALVMDETVGPVDDMAIRAMLDMQKTTRIPLDWPSPVTPVFDPTGTRVFLLGSLDRSIQIRDLTQPSEMIASLDTKEPPSQNRDLTYELEVTDLSRDHGAVYATYGQRIESKSTLEVWEVNREKGAEHLRALGKGSAYLPLSFSDFSAPKGKDAPGRILISGADRLLICHHTGWNRGSVTVPAAGALLPIVYPDGQEKEAGVKHPAKGLVVKEVTGEMGRYVVESTEGQQISSFQVKSAPGEWGFLPEYCTFSPKGDWVIVVGKGSVTKRGTYQGRGAKPPTGQIAEEDPGVADLPLLMSPPPLGQLYLTEVFDARTGRLLYGPLEGGLVAISRDGHFAQLTYNAIRSTGFLNTLSLSRKTTDKLVPLRMLEGNAPAWFLDFIDAITCCQVKSGSPEDVPPETLPRLLERFAKELALPESKPFRQYIEQRFGKE